MMLTHTCLRWFSLQLTTEDERVGGEWRTQTEPLREQKDDNQDKGMIAKYYNEEVSAIIFK